MKRAKITSATLRNLFAGNGNSSFVESPDELEYNEEVNDLAEQISARMKVIATDELPEIDTGDDDEVFAEFEEDEEIDDNELVTLDSNFEDVQGIQDVNDGLDELTPLDSVSIEEDEDEELEAGDDEDAVDDGAENIVDAVEVDDDGDLEVIPVGDELIAIASNVVVARMNRKQATKAGVSDIYKGASFASVVESSVQNKGLRRGLVESGFAMVKAKVKAGVVSKNQLRASVEQALAASNAKVIASQKSFEQAAAIAAVGINRKFFKDTENTLRASLEQELTRAGFQGAKTLVRSCFAKHGIDYAKDILVLAKKLAAQPQDVRDNYVTALDMTSEDLEPEDISAESEEFEDNVSITAALLKPATKQNMAIMANATNHAQAILSGRASLV